jgi:hypothetical protein
MNSGLIVKLKYSASDLEKGEMGVILESENGLIAVFKGGLKIPCDGKSDVLEVAGLAPHLSKAACDFEKLSANITEFGVGETVYATAYILDDKHGVKADYIHEEALGYYEEIKSLVLKSNSPRDEVNMFVYGVGAGIDHRYLYKEIDAHVWAFGIEDLSHSTVKNPHFKELSLEIVHHEAIEGRDLVDVAILGAGQIRRAVYSPNIKNGDLFNVYHGESSKTGMFWKNSIEETIINSELYAETMVKEVYITMLLEREPDSDAKEALKGPSIHATREKALDSVYDYVASRIPSELPATFTDWAIEEYSNLDFSNCHLDFSNSSQGDAEDAIEILFILSGSYKQNIVDWYFDLQNTDNCEAWYSITSTSI